MSDKPPCQHLKIISYSSMGIKSLKNLPKDDSIAGHLNGVTIGKEKPLVLERNSRKVCSICGDVLEDVTKEDLGGVRITVDNLKESKWGRR